jgi:hypothetical protein
MSGVYLPDRNLGIRLGKPAVLAFALPGVMVSCLYSYPNQVSFSSEAGTLHDHLTVPVCPPP